MDYRRTRIVLVAFGTSGDVFPFIAIGSALRARGHEVVLVTNDYFATTAQNAGLDVAPVGSDASYRRALAEGDLWSSRRGLDVVMNSLLPDPLAVYDTIVDELLPTRTVIASHPFAFASRLVQQVRNTPCVTLVLSTCLLRSNCRVPVMVEDLELSKMAPPLKRLMWWFADRLLIDPAVKPRLRRALDHLGLAPVTRPFDGWMFSPSSTIGLFPKWFAPPQPDWPAQLRLTGFPDFCGTSPLPDVVKRFIDAGSPPIVATTGSAAVDTDDFATSVAGACRHTGHRALFLGASSNTMPNRSDEQSRFLAVDFAPLDEVLPHSSILIHHGGIGTTAAALRAAIPQIVRPIAHDHFDHAERIRRNGVGKRLLPRQFSTSTLRRTLDEILGDPAIQRRCEDRATQIHQNDAVAATCQLIEQPLPRSRFDSVAPRATSPSQETDLNR